MMPFVWMFIWALVIIIATSLLMGVFVRSLQQKGVKRFVCFGAAAAWILVCFIILWTFQKKIPLSLPILNGFWLVSGIIAFIQAKVTGIFKEVFLLALSVVLSLTIPVTITLSPAMLFCIYPLLGISLYLMVRIFSILDRVPMLSLITLLAQGLLIVLLGGQGLLTHDLLMLLFYGFVVTMTIAQSTKIFIGKTVLGSVVSPMVGFIIGYFWTYMMAQGAWGIPLVLFGTDIFELFFVGTIALFSKKPLLGPETPFLIETAIARNIAPNKLDRYLLFIFLILSCLGLLVANEGLDKITSIFLCFILLHYYFRLKHWGEPKPSFRQLGSDIKAGLKELKNEINHIPLKSDKKVKKAVVSTHKGKKRKSK